MPLTTLILCGGKGTRAWPHTQTIPKPLLEVDGQPVVRHVMEIYAAQGHDHFVLAAGYMHESIRAFVAQVPASWTVTVVDTGLDTNTGARVAACREHLSDPFMVTYADGLGDVDLAALLSFHSDHAGLATLTTVALPSPYGTIDSDESGRVARFREKPQLEDHRINAGFLVFDGDALDRWAGDDLERDVLPALGAAGDLFAFHHAGFWKSMDTYKDALELNDLCAGGSPPWRR